MSKNIVDVEVLLVEDIMRMLNIGKNLAYKLVKEEKFPVIKIKGVYRIPKQPFEQWLNNGT